MRTLKVEKLSKIPTISETFFLCSVLKIGLFDAPDWIPATEPLDRSQALFFKICCRPESYFGILL
jgi:hypothetical protein